MHVAKAQRPEQSLWLLDPAAAVAVYDNDPPAFDSDLPTRGQRREILIVVSAHGIDRGDGLEGGDGLRSVDVTGMNDHVDASEDLEDTIGKPVDEFGAMTVSDHANACSQRPDFLPRTCGTAAAI
jgi:hypothetical protein